jgi:hypothetical protein
MGVQTTLGFTRWQFTRCHSYDNTTGIVPITTTLWQLTTHDFFTVRVTASGCILLFVGSLKTTVVVVVVVVTNSSLIIIYSSIAVVD